MARGLVRTPDDMPARVNVRFSYSSKDADVKEWVWRQRLGVVSELASEYIAAVARGEVVPGFWQHDLASSTPAPGRDGSVEEGVELPATLARQEPGMRGDSAYVSALAKSAVTTASKAVVEANAPPAIREPRDEAPSHQSPPPVEPVVDSKDDGGSGPPTMAAGKSEPAAAPAAPAVVPPPEVRRAAQPASPTPKPAPAAPVVDPAPPAPAPERPLAAAPVPASAASTATSGEAESPAGLPAANETSGEGGMRREDVQRIIQQAKSWQKQ